MSCCRPTTQKCTLAVIEARGSSARTLAETSHHHPQLSGTFGHHNGGSCEARARGARHSLAILEHILTESRLWVLAARHEPPCTLHQGYGPRFAPSEAPHLERAVLSSRLTQLTLVACEVTVIHPLPVVELDVGEAARHLTERAAEAHHIVHRQARLRQKAH